MFGTQNNHAMRKKKKIIGIHVSFTHLRRRVLPQNPLEAPQPQNMRKDQLLVLITK
jgi:hypothetical protein